MNLYKNRGFVSVLSLCGGMSCGKIAFIDLGSYFSDIGAFKHHLINYFRH